KGLSDLIREEFGLRITFFTMLVLSVADLGNIAAEFAGLASGMGIFGVEKYIAVHAGAVLIWMVVVRGSYKPVERILIVLSLLYLAYPVSAFLARPDWHEALRQTMVPQFHGDSAYIVMLVGLIGTTITPWMQFYLQASVVEKGITQKQYALSRWDVIAGCIMTDAIAFFIVIACAATLYKSGHRDIADAAEAAVALRPFAGKFASLLFGVGLVNASLLSAAILPLATAYNVCEGLGFESGIDRRFSEAPAFYWLYTALIVLGAGFVLMPHLPLLKVILLSQVANGILIPFVLLFMLSLVNRKKLMGAMKNGWAANTVAIATCAVMIGLTAAMVWTTLAGF
ncbi:MAG: NRAMP family divalent metal transporter, partial [Bryobacteraceae bacterium]